MEWSGEAGRRATGLNRWTYAALLSAGLWSVKGVEDAGDGSTGLDEREKQQCTNAHTYILMYAGRFVRSSINLSNRIEGRQQTRAEQVGDMSA